MIKFLNPRNAVFAFAVIGFAGIGLSSFASQASASIVDECHGSSKVKVVACCKQHIERFGMPMWMSNGEDSNCRAATVCAGKKSSTPFAAVAVVYPRLRCFLQMPINIKDGGNRPTVPPTSNNPNVRGTPGVNLTHG